MLVSIGAATNQCKLPILSVENALTRWIHKNIIDWIVVHRIAGEISMPDVSLEPDSKNCFFGAWQTVGKKPLNQYEGRRCVASLRCLCTLAPSQKTVRPGTSKAKSFLPKRGAWS